MSAFTEEEAHAHRNGDGPADERRAPTDLVGLLRQPRKPVPWRVEGLAADGKLTCLTGRGDAGKSWLAIACALRVYDGGHVAGMRCAIGRALYIDAEMGEDEFVDRLRLFQAGGEELDHYDGSGWDLSRKPDLDEIEALIVDGGYQFVVLDSLRALAPSMKENESDSVGPIITAVRNLARRTVAAVVLVHHRGDGEKAYRGSSAIRDQSDAMLTMHDDDDRGLRLQCKPGGRVRFARAPDDRWLSLDLLGEHPEGVRAAGDPEPPPPSAHEILKNQILRHLPSGTKSAVAEALGTSRDASAFTRAWKALQNEHKIDQINGIWTVVVAGESLGSPPPPQHPQTTFGGDR